MSVLYAPKKFRSQRIHINPQTGYNLKKKFKYGYAGVFSRGYGHLNWRNLEAGRRCLTRQLKRKVKVWLKVRLTQPITAKAKLSRMGKGKGKFKGWVGYAIPGITLYEMGFITTTAIEENKDIHSAIKNELPFEKIKQKFQFPVEVIKRNINYDKKCHFYKELGYKKYKKNKNPYFIFYRKHKKKKYKMKKIKWEVPKKIKKKEKIFFFSQNAKI